MGFSFSGQKVGLYTPIYSHAANREATVYYVAASLITQFEINVQALDRVGEVTGSADHGSNG